MFDYSGKSTSLSKPVRGGRGLTDSIINNLPFELHLPGYQYCGPGTKLQKRLERGDPGINSLDKACREHDIAYSQNKDRHTADRALYNKAWQIATTKTNKLGERSSAWFVTNAMKAKVKLGMGVKLKGKITSQSKGIKGKLKRKIAKVKKAISFHSAIRNARKVLKNTPLKNINEAIKMAVKAVKKVIKSRKQVKTPRIIPVPKTGGVLPFLVPLFAGLSAIGALSGGAAGVAKAVNEAHNAKKQLNESERHNRQMEAVLLGRGLHLKPYKKGLGLYLEPHPKNF